MDSDDESTYDTLAHPAPRLDVDGIPLNLAAGISAFLMPSAIAPTGHQGDLPTANPTPQRRWGAVEPRYPPAL